MERDKNIYNKINDIVFDSLARRCSVYIDGLGSLVITTENAKINAKESYIFHKIVLVRDENSGVDIKAHTLALSGINKKNIDDIYSKWLIECGVGEDISKFTIDGVVLCEDGKIKLSEGLNNYLNPLFCGNKGARKKLNPLDYGKKVKGTAVLLIFTILAIAGVSYYGYENRNTGFMKWLVVDNLDITEDSDSSVFDSVVMSEYVITPDTISMTKLVPATQVAVGLTKEEVVTVMKSNDGFYVVVGSYRDLKNVDKKLSVVKRKYKSAKVLKFDDIYYVVIDKYTDLNSALNIKDISGKADYWVMRVVNNKIVYNK